MRCTKWLMSLILIGGTLLLGTMIWRVGITGVLDSFRAMGWWILPYLLLRLISTVLHTAGWMACFPDVHLPCRFWHLMLVMRAGSAINQVTPTADIGGEVVRVMLLKPFVPREQALAAVVIDKASGALSQMLYIGSGMVYLIQYLPLPLTLQLSVALTTGFIILGVGGFVVLQRYGWSSKGVQWVTADDVFPTSLIPTKWQYRLQSLRDTVWRLDVQFATYYTQYPWRFVASVLWHGAANAFDIVKTYFLLCFLLGSNALSWSEAAMVAIVVAALDQMLFFVPGRLGTLEAARFFVLSIFSIAQVYGLAFGLIARVEQLVWSGIGLIAYAYCTHFLFAPAMTVSDLPCQSE